MTQAGGSVLPRGEARRVQFLRGIDITNGSGLEIGALNRPTILRSDGHIHFVDFTTTAHLRDLYASIGTVDTAQIVDVDFVWSNGSRLCDVVSGQSFDYVLASHVIEHAPNLISWLQQISECLREDGLLSLIIPDKRFTFDRLRSTTSMGEVVGNYIQHVTRPTPAQVYNHLAYHVAVDDVSKLWGNIDGSVPLKRVHTDVEAFSVSYTVWSTGEYFDVHCTIFTPASALDLLECMFQLKLIPFVIADFAPTYQNEIDFFLTLRKVESLTSDELLKLQMESLEKARGYL